MILAVVGSRELSDVQKPVAVAHIAEALRSLKPDLVVSGGAAGVDTLADREARRLGVDMRVYLPTERQWQPNGYKERNEHIAQSCTHLLCIRPKDSKSYGSGWTADYAESIGKQVWRVEL